MSRQDGRPLSPASRPQSHPFRMPCRPSRRPASSTAPRRRTHPRGFRPAVCLSRQRPSASAVRRHSPKLFRDIVDAFHFSLALALAGRIIRVFHVRVGGNRMSVDIGREAPSRISKEHPIVEVLRESVSSNVDDFGSETRPHLPHACCSGEAGHCYPRIKSSS